VFTLRKERQSLPIHTDQCCKPTLERSGCVNVHNIRCTLLEAKSQGAADVHAPVCTLQPVCELRDRRTYLTAAQASGPSLRQPIVKFSTCRVMYVLPAHREVHAHLRCSVRDCIPFHRQPCFLTLRSLMARTKYIPKPKPPNSATSKHPQETGKRAAWTAVIELGASNGQAMVKKPGGAWELVRWAQGAGASSVGGAEAIPALTAIHKGGQEPRDVRHGHAAVRARKKDPMDWEMFAYPKFVFMDEEATPDIQQQLELQKEKASALGTTPEEVAIGFFRHMTSEVVGSKGETFNVYVNISDRWRNRPVQELMMSFQKVGTNAYFEHVDECLSTLAGRVSSRKDDLSTGEVVVVVDCGHSTMVSLCV